MDMLNKVHWPQQVGFTRAGRATALINPAHCVRRAEDHGAACQSVKIVCVPNADTRNVSERAV
jgi:hypothetical protein